MAGQYVCRYVANQHILTDKFSIATCVSGLRLSECNSHGT